MITSGAAESLAQVTFQNNSYVSGRYVGFDGSSGINPLLIKNNGITRIHINGSTTAYGINTNGFIGVGISAPASPLHIEGKGIQNEQGWYRGLTLSNRAAIMWDGGSGKGFFMAHPSSSPNGNFYAGIADNLNSNALVNYAFSIHVNQPLGLNPAGTAQFYKNLLVYDPTSERRIGINTSAPQRALEVTDAGASTTDAQLRLTSSMVAYTDVRTSPNGVCYLTPSAGKTVIGPVGSTVAPTAVVDVVGDLRIRKVSEETADALFVGKANGTNLDLSVRRLDFTGNAQDVLLGDGTWGAVMPNGLAENGTSISTSNAVEWGGSPLLHDTQIPMNGYNVFFTHPASSTSMSNTIKIGGNTVALPAKLSVINENEPNGLIVRSITSSPFPGIKTGVHAESVQAQIAVGVSAKSSSGEQVFGVKAAAYNGTSLTVGAHAHASSGNTGEVYGGQFSAISSTVGSNRGVVGSATGSPKTNIGGYFSGNGGTTSIGVYGQASSNQPGAVTWAGYFAGPVLTSGTYITSDSQFKTNIQPLNPMTDLLNALNPVSYDYLQTGNAAYLNFDSVPQFGFIAQEVQQLFPQLLRSSSHPTLVDSVGNILAPAFDYESINYTAFIPMLIKGFQEQHERINQLVNQNGQLMLQSTSLQNQLDALNTCLSAQFPELCSGQSQGKIDQFDNLNRMELGNPNPFNHSTRIRVHLAESIKDARLKLYMMGGALVKEQVINARGEVDTILTRDHLAKGKYICILYTDGEPVSTQQLLID